jgi:hypothetical protein
MTSALAWRRVDIYRRKIKIRIELDGLRGEDSNAEI